MVPANASLLSASDRLCFARNTQKQDRWRREHEQLPPNATAKQRNRRMPDDSWLCYWNANFRVEFRSYDQRWLSLLVIGSTASTPVRLRGRARRTAGQCSLRVGINVVIWV